MKRDTPKMQGAKEKKTSDKQAPPKHKGLRKKRCPMKKEAPQNTRG
jgi:hypothetical protein